MGRYPTRYGRGRGRFGRYQGRGRSGQNKARNDAQVRDINQQKFMVGTARQASEFIKIKKHCINTFKVKYKQGIYIATAIENGQEYDFSNDKPTPLVLVAETGDDTSVLRAKGKNESSKIEYKMQMERYNEKVEIYAENKIKAYGFLWEKCSSQMKQNIEAKANFVATIKDNPFELLKAIESLSYNYQESKYEVAIVYDAIKTFINLKQREEENLTSYLERFKAAAENMKTQLGSEIKLTKYTTQMDGYDSSEHEKYSKKAFEEMKAYAFIANSDSTKYGTIIKGLAQQQSLKNTQYPKTLTAASEVLMEHTWDATYQENKKKKKEQSNKDKEIKEDKKEELELSFAQLENACYCCGKKGHTSNKCYKKDSIPRDQWYINKLQKQELAKMQQHVQVGGDNASAAPTTITQETTTPSGTMQAWSGAHIQFSQAGNADLKNLILLDNGSSTSIFANPRMVTGIKTTATPLQLMTNGGELITDQKASVPGFGEVWYDSQSIANIFSFAELKDKHKITYDSSKEDAFNIHLPNKTIKFTRTANGLYVYKPNDHVLGKVSLLNTTNENEQMYTRRQIARAKVARKLYHNVGTPSIRDFKAIIRMNAIQNCPVTSEDIEIAEQVFGKDIGSLKGKTVRSKPLPVIKDYVNIPKELMIRHENIELAMDMMFVNKIPFLTTISKHIMYRTAQPLPNKTVKAYRSAIDVVFRLYNHAGFKITVIKADREFQPIFEDIKDDLDITMNYASAQEHVPEAERNNRTIKERFRSHFQRLPYKNIPKVMIKALVMEATKKLNFFPPQGGVSQYYSPRMILHQSPLNYDKHFTHEFGQFVQAHNDNPKTKNTTAPRTLDCIYLRYTNAQQGGHELLDLHTAQVITRHAVTAVPITPLIVKRVEALASKDGVKNIKFVFRNHALIAGVDDNEEDNEEEDNEEYDDEDYSEGAEEGEHYNDETNNETNKVTSDEQNTIQNEQPNDEAKDNEEDDEDNNNDDEQRESNQTMEDEAETEEQEIVFEQDDEMEEAPLFEDYGDLQEPVLRRSTRETRPPVDYKPTFGGQKYQHLHVQTEDSTIHYDSVRATVAAMAIHKLNLMQAKATKQGVSLVETYSLKKGLKKFGKRAEQSATKEMKQLHDRVCFRPINPSEMTTDERKKAMESLIFLTEKRDGRLKARTVANGSVQRKWMEREDTASPTTALESVLLSATIDAKEGRDVATVDIPNAFIQTEVPQEKGKERIILKIRGRLVDILEQIDPATYKPFVQYENGAKILYCNVLRAIYGMLTSALLFYKKWRSDLIKRGYKINPYDPCVANKFINGKQHTVMWHVDDLKISHVDKKVNDEFIKWVDELYGDDEIGRVKAVRGKKHDYIGMILDYSVPGQVTIDMKYYVEAMIDQYKHEMSDKITSPASENLFKINKHSPKIDKILAEEFHTTVARGLFVSKRARPDIQPTIAFLCTRVREPTKDDWNKLNRLMSYLKKTKNEVLVLKCDGKNEVKWWVDAAFAVHPDMKSHTGAVMTMGSGAVQAISKKQKVNTRSSTEAELVATDDVIAQVVWTRNFLEAQGVRVDRNIVYQDNQSAMLLEKNGRSSAGKRSRHLDIRYFFITDQVEKGNMEVRYCPTDMMTADYMTKPLHGQKFQKFKKEIMNIHI